MDEHPTQTPGSLPAATVATSTRIIGVDPGLQRTGYAVIECDSVARDGNLIEAGVIRLTPRTPIELRLLELSENLDQIIVQRQPAILACEQLYSHYKHPRTAILMGHARGVILALAASRGLRVLNIASTHVKRTLTGNGHAGKAQMQRAVAAALHLPRLPEPHDVADAIAIAVCGGRLNGAESRGPR
jgi:crossover junction endodeoxyribonuclease RuvC